MHEGTRYSFLARPPPEKKRRTRKVPSPLICIPPPAPSLYRASSIAAWAALVQPGSPAPNSPFVSHAVASASARETEADVGCPSVFVDMPTRPPSKKLSTARYIIKRLRSLGFRSKPSAPVGGAELAEKGKWSTAHDLALMQLLAGGSTESNVRRLMAEGGGVGDVFRDEKGRIWMDEDEEMECAHLLGGEEIEESSDSSAVRGQSVLAVPCRRKKHLGTAAFLLQ